MSLRRVELSPVNCIPSTVNGLVAPLRNASGLQALYVISAHASTPLPLIARDETDETGDWLVALDLELPLFRLDAVEIQ